MTRNWKLALLVVLLSVGAVVAYTVSADYTNFEKVFTREINLGTDGTNEILLKSTGDVFWADLNSDSTKDANEVMYDKDADGTKNNSCGNIISTAVNPDEAGTNLYVSLVSGTSPNATETSVDNYLSPGKALTVGNLSCVVDVAPGAGNSWVVVLRDDAANTTLTCTIATSATTCSDVTHFPSVAAGSKLDLSITGVSSPDAAAEFMCSLCVGTN